MDKKRIRLLMIFRNKFVGEELNDIIREEFMMMEVVKRRVLILMSLGG